MGISGRGNVGATRSRRRGFALLASTVLVFGSTLPIVISRPASAQATAQPISVQAGSLTRALNDLAAQTGLQIIFDASLANGKTTGGASGTMTPNQALHAVLAGTGVTASFAGANQIALDNSTDAVPPDTTLLDTIRIYGARDATTLEDTSASVGVVTSEDIDYGQIQYLPGAMRRMANVEKGATNNTGIVIRGMNFEGFSPAGAPMGSIYVDGILQSRYNSRFGARGLWDAEQVEVYRGPQSTLSGRAATAGAIYLKTQDPTFENEVVLSGTVGNKDLAGGAFVVNTPLSEPAGLALRIAGSYEQATTEIEYPTYTHFANYDEFRTELSGNLRAKLLFEPDELPDTRALLTYSYSKDRPNERLVNPVTGNGDLYFLPTLAEFRVIGMHNAGLEITHNLTPALTLTSQSSFSHGLTERESIDNGTAGVANAWYGTYKDTLASQELRLNYEQGRWTWVAGLFGSYEYQDSDLFWRATEFNLAQESLYYRETTNLAAFGEAKYEFLPGWKLILGGRVDYIDETTTDDSTSIFMGIRYPTVTTGHIEEVNFVPKIGISREFNEHHVAGATYSQGFRTGGFYVDSVTGEAVQYNPEYADNYELFYKGKFLEERLRINANVFYTRYRDQQVESIAPGIGGGIIISNAASSHSYGFELESTFDITENMSVFTSLGYLHTEFQEFDHRIYGDLAGESFPEAPEWTLAFGGRYTLDNGFYIGGDAKYVSGYNARFNVAAPLEEIESRLIVNLQAGIRRDNWEINAFVENLFDEHYYTTLELQGSGVNPTFAQVGPSRLFGMNVKAKF